MSKESLINSVEYETFIEELVKVKALLNDVRSFEIDNINGAVLSDLLKRPALLDYDEEEGVIKYKEEDNDEWKEIPDFSSGVIENGAWLSKYLPVPKFSLDEDSDISELKERESFYTCACIASILQSVYKEELLALSKDYNYKEPTKNFSNNFSSLLSEWKELNSTTIRVIVSAANVRIFDTKKGGGIINLKELSTKETLELEELLLKIKAINIKYSLGDLSPDKIKDYTKIERLQKIDEKDKEINALVNASNVSMLYRISKLTIDTIPPIIERKIVKEATKQAMIIKSKDSLNDFEFERAKRLFIRKAKRVKLSQIAAKCLQDYRSDKENYILPVKR